jgi:hypothetical protein
VPVLILIAVVAVLAGVFVAATGRGGELAYERVDHAPLDLGPVSAPDVAMLRPPTAIWGYNVQVTDEALDLIARAMRDRDVTIAYLQQQLANRVSADPDPRQARQTAGNPAAYEATQTAGNPGGSEALRADGNPEAPEIPRVAKAPGVLVAPLPPKATQPSATAPSPEAAQPAQPVEATQPSQTLPDLYEAQGPQGAYDTHGWWAQQEQAAREEEARRQAAAQEAGLAPPDAADLPEASAPEASAPEASAPEADPPEAGSPTGRTRTLPNPVITPPDGTATSSGHGGQPAAGSGRAAGSVPPDDDTLAEAEEQGW